jgi:hypothetical protein
MTTSWAPAAPLTTRPPYTSRTGTGAVVPSMVMNGPATTISLPSANQPPVSKTTVRLPTDTASRRLPGPWSAVVVTW